jgi:hypothetical protein
MYSRAPVSTDSVSVVYRGPGKICKIKEMNSSTFQNECQERMGHNMVKSSSPNMPSTWLIFLCPQTHAIMSSDKVHKMYYFLNIHLNIILPSMHGSPQCSLSLRFPHKNPLHASPLPHLSYMPHPSNSSRFYHPHNSAWGVQITAPDYEQVTYSYIKSYSNVSNKRTD